MAGKRRLKIKLEPGIALSVSRIKLNGSKLVYALVANKKLEYLNGKSAIAYIGTTEKGLSRIAASAAFHADEVLNLHGVTNVTARVLTCRPRQKVKTWRKLERAMLLMFREKYGAIPRQNTQGAKIKVLDEFDYFARDAVRKTIERIG